MNGSFRRSKKRAANTATPVHADTVGVTATNTIYHDREHPSALILPLLPLKE